MDGRSVAGGAGRGARAGCAGGGRGQARQCPGPAALHGRVVHGGVASRASATRPVKCDMYTRCDRVQ